MIANTNDGRELGNLFKNVSNRELNDNLVAYFPFNGNANDESIFKQKTYMQNVILCEDRYGRKNQAFDFNGKNSCISTDKKNVLNNTESITISLWINPRRAKNWESWICKDRPKWASKWRMGFGENKNNEWGFTMCELNGGNNYWTNYWLTNSEILFNKWTHVAFSADQDKHIMTVYMNEKMVGVLRNLRSFEKSEGSVRIGYQTDDNVYFDGKIDDIRIYNRVLSNEEVRELYEMD